MLALSHQNVTTKQAITLLCESGITQKRDTITQNCGTITQLSDKQYQPSHFYVILDFFIFITLYRDSQKQQNTLSRENVIKTVDKK